MGFVLVAPYDRGCPSNMNSDLQLNAFLSNIAHKDAPLCA
jgi:hypothetical protein